MIKLLRFFFIVQYDYRSSAQSTRARVLLPLIGIIALLALIFGLFLLIAAVADISLRANVLASGGIIAPILIVLTCFALWLIQRGYVSISAALLGGLLAGIAGISLAADGIAAAPLLTVSVLMVYMGLVYGPRGIVLVTLLSWGALPLTAYLEAEGRLAVETTVSRNDLIYEALVSAQMLTLSAVLLGIFAWNLQNSLTRTARIATQTRATAAIGQALSLILNLNELLTSAAELIRDRFALYHVQIFLLDDARAYANLAASTGEIGQSLLAQGFRVSLESRSIVAEVVSTGDMRNVGNTLTAPYPLSGPLTDARSELAIPLVAGEEITGVLDIRSTRVNAFSEEDVETFRIVANQLSQAIRNARLFENQQRGLLQNRRLFLESETNLREIERLNRQLTSQSWHEYLFERDWDQLGIKFVGEELSTDHVEWTPAMQQATERRRLISQENQSEQIIAVPISIRGQPIGAIEVRLTGPHSQSEVRAVLQAVTERMAFSLENARLFDQARTAAQREQQINQITARLQGLTSVEDVLATAVSTLAEALDAQQGAIRLAGLKPTSGEEPSADNGHRSPSPGLVPTRITTETGSQPAPDEDTPA